MSGLISRRALVGGAAAGAGLLLSGCDKLAQNQTFRDVLFSAENVHRWTQQALSNRNSLAKEFRPDQMSPVFRANGTRLPSGSGYAAHAAGGFRDWRVAVSGLVAKPLSLSMADIRALREMASMGPRLNGRGAMFLKAATAAAQLASMGPRLNGRGANRRPVLMTLPAWLQWGRG